MTWRPLIVGDRRVALEAVIRDLVAGIDQTEATTLGDHVDRALLHAYVALDDVVPDPDDRSGAALSQAVAELAHARVGPALFGGAAGVGWCISHLAGGDTADLVCTRVDEVLLRLLADWRGDYDLVSGLVGVGVYALARGEPGQPLACRVLEELARRARPHGGGLAWHTPPEHQSPLQRTEAPDGCWNLGLSHGTPGAIALLARYLAAGVEPSRARELLDGAMAFVLAAAPARDDGRYPAWHPGGADAPARSAPHHPAHARLAWCYNDLGVSVALLSAALATGDAGWRGEALALARSCAGRSIDDARVRDAAICHGALGAAHLFNRLGQATGEAVFTAAALRWLDDGLGRRNDRPIAGFPTFAAQDDALWIADASLVGGATGIALALHAMITEAEPSWDGALLIDLPTLPTAEP